MGTYDDLLKLDQTLPLAAPKPSKTADMPVTHSEPPAPSQPAKKTPTKAQAAPSILGVDHRRNTTRGSFEVYQDQLRVLRQVSLQARLSGDDLSMSEMVREALDEYIHHKDLTP